MGKNRELSPFVSGIRRFLAVPFFLMSILIGGESHADCASYRGKVVINEYNFIENWIELKVLDPSLTAGGVNPFDKVKLVIWGKQGNSMVKKKEVSVGSNYTDIAKNSCDKSKNTIYVQNPFSANEMGDDVIVVLWKTDEGAKGRVIDVFRLGQASLAEYPLSINSGYTQYDQCSPIESALPSPLYDAPLTGSSGHKDIARLPDGTGFWSISNGTGANSQDSLCGTNDALFPLTKTPSSSSVGVGTGNTFTWTLEVKNGGDSGNLGNVTVSDTLPANMLLTTCPVGATCTGAAGSYTGFSKNLGTLVPGALATITATAYVTAAGSYVNEAKATADELAPGYVLATGKVTATAGPEHVEFVHGGSALTCTPKEITILGCTTSASCYNDSAKQYVGTFSVTPTAIPSAQWCSDSLCASPITGAISVSNGAVIYLREPVARLDRMAATVTGATNPTAQCTNTSIPAFNSTTACDVLFASAGFVVSAPNHYSCAPQTVTLQAVKSSSTGTACIPAFQNVNRSITLYSGYTNPISGTKTVSFNYVTSSGGATSTVSALSTSSASPTTLSNLYFDNTGTATFSNFVYPDVGQITLFPVYTGSAATGDNGLSLAAVSGNSFIAAPKSFAVAPAGPYVAGQSFLAKVTAMNNCATPSVTPNFGKESPAPEDVTLTFAKCQPTGASAVNGVFTGSVGSFNNGEASSSNLVWNEVGNIDLIAMLVSGSYLGSGLTAAGNTGSAGSTCTAAGGAGTVGRFIPHHFDTVVTQGCDAGVFTYSGQPFQVTVTAKNGLVSPTTTLNYDGTASTSPNFAKAVTLSDANVATVGALSNTTVAAALFAQGVAATPNPPTTSSPIYTFTSRQTVPTTIKLRAIDTDNVSSETGSEGTANIRSGRARISNAYGSELLDLAMSFRTEYWNGTGWMLNSADVCTGDTTLGAANAVSLALSPGLTCVWDTLPVPGLSNAGCAASAPAGRNFKEGATPSVFFTGNFNLWLKKPGSAGTVTVTPSVPAWLGPVPPALATFGIYKTPIIYMRENY